MYLTVPDLKKTESDDIDQRRRSSSFSINKKYFEEKSNPNQDKVEVIEDPEVEQSTLKKVSSSKSMLSLFRKWQ